MTELEIRDYILIYLAELYENPMSRTQWKRFTFESINDQQIALSVLRNLASNLTVEQKEPGVVRLNSIGYRMIERELPGLRTKPGGARVDERPILPPPTHDEIRRISDELGQPPDYITASRIVEGRSEMFWESGGYQKLTGYTVDEINISGGAVMLPDNSEMEKLKELVEGLFNGQKVHGDFKIKTKRGDLLTLIFVAWPLFDKEGHVVGSLTAARQIRDADTISSLRKR